MKKNYPSTDRDKMVIGGTYSVIVQHKGKRNRITRERLREEVDAGLCGQYGTIEDRDVRNAIEYLRMTYEGSRILSTSGSSGYWMAESLDEFMDCINEDRRRALSILIRIHKQKKAAKKHFAYQERLPLFEFAEIENEIGGNCVR
jgi:hypothetical protein